MSSPKKPFSLRGRRAPIAMSGEEFRAAGHRLVDEIADFFDSLPQRPVTRASEPSGMRAFLPPDALPASGEDAGKLLQETSRLLFDHSLHNGHPRFLGYITSSAAPLGALGDLLAAAVNPNLGGWQLSPIATEIEKQAVRWVAELLGYPTDCGGLFVSGGNMANFAAFLAARQARVPWDARRDGLRAGGESLAVYASTETHTWIQKALDLFGHGTAAMRSIPVGADLRADAKALRRMVADDRERGDRPFLVVASAGTVSTGAIDPIREMAAIAREQGAWLHVDGAYGGFAAALADAPEDLKALNLADSVAVDPHKWLYTPLEAGCLLVRDAESLPAAFAYGPPYYHFQEGEEERTNFYEHGMQNSRGFRALKVWLTLRQVGRSGFVRMIEDDIRLADEMYRLFDEHPEIEAVTRGLSITTFRYVPRDLQPGSEPVEEYLDRLNDALITRLKTGGEVFFSNAVVGGRTLVRSCVVNFRTGLEDVEALPEIVTRNGREVDRQLRPEGL